jgi:hypothetical protein
MGAEETDWDDPRVLVLSQITSVGKRSYTRRRSAGSVVSINLKRVQTFAQLYARQTDYEGETPRLMEVN